jgi:hypothetical protein
MGEVHDIAVWRARRAAGDDIPIGAPRPFVLQEACPGFGARRVSTIIWRMNPGKGRRVAFPRIAPYFLCRDGRVLWQEITDAPIPISAWSGILGQFKMAQEG